MDKISYCSTCGKFVGHFDQFMTAVIKYETNNRSENPNEYIDIVNITNMRNKDNFVKKEIHDIVGITQLCCKSINVQCVPDEIKYSRLYITNSQDKQQ